MKKTAVLALFLSFSAFFSLVLASCTKSDDSEKFGGTAVAEVSNGDTIVRVSFGADYAYKYASVTVKDSNGCVAYLTQLQLDGEGYGETTVIVKSAGKYFVEAVSGELCKIAEFTMEG